MSAQDRPKLVYNSMRTKNCRRLSAKTVQVSARNSAATNATVCVPSAILSSCCAIRTRCYRTAAAAAGRVSKDFNSTIQRLYSSSSGSSRVGPCRITTLYMERKSLHSTLHNTKQLVACFMPSVTAHALSYCNDSTLYIKRSVYMLQV
jgi:hypothetical protein